MVQLDAQFEMEELATQALVPGVTTTHPGIPGQRSEARARAHECVQCPSSFVVVARGSRSRKVSSINTVGETAWRLHCSMLAMHSTCVLLLKVSLRCCMLV